jgi:hypothetical protein
MAADGRGKVIFNIPYTPEAERVTASNNKPDLSVLGELIDGYAPAFGGEPEQVSEQNQADASTVVALRKIVAGLQEDNRILRDALAKMAGVAIDARAKIEGELAKRVAA